MKSTHICLTDQLIKGGHAPKWLAPSICEQANRLKLAKGSREQQEWQQKEDIAMFGEVLSDHERKRRTYPSSKVDGRESYNDQLKREKEEHRQELHQKLSQIYRRRELVPEIEKELKWLKATAEKDNELEKQLEDELKSFS